MNTYQEIEDLAEIIYTNATDQETIDALDTIILKCKAFLTDADPAECRINLKFRVTPTERVLLNALHASLGKCVSQQTLYNLRYGIKDEVDHKIIPVQICHLRSKLRHSGYRIETIWGLGYRMVTCEPGKELEHINPSKGRTNAAAYMQRAA